LLHGQWCHGRRRVGEATGFQRRRIKINGSGNFNTVASAARGQDDCVLAELLAHGPQGLAHVTSGMSDDLHLTFLLQ
jgi:hypothetical protein